MPLMLGSVADRACATQKWLGWAGRLGWAKCTVFTYLDDLGQWTVRLFKRKA